MVTIFKSDTSSSISGSTFATGKIFARSTSSGDTASITVSGLSAPTTAQSDELTLNGQREVVSTNNFTRIIAAKMSATQAGTVSIFREGTKAQGTFFMTEQPSNGQTVTIGLTGSTKVYTFRAKGHVTAVCRDTASLTQGDYFDVSLSGATMRFWYDIDEAGTGEPTDPGGGVYPIDIETGNTDAQVASATQAALDAITNLTATVSTNTITLKYDILGVLSVTDGPGDALGTITTVAGGTADAANQVAIGSTVADTITNLRYAINDSVGVEGVNYGTGTTANLYVSATNSGSILTMTDKIGCNRATAWACATNTTGSISNPVGGTDGFLLAVINPGVEHLYGEVILDDESLTLGRMPGLIDWVSAPIRLSAARFTLFLRAEDVTTPLNVSYQYSLDTTQTPVNWRDGTQAIDDLDDNYQVITPPENVEWIRLLIENQNTNPVSIDAKVCHERA